MLSESLRPANVEQVNEGASLFDLLFDQEVISISYDETPNLDTVGGTEQAQPAPTVGVVSVGETIAPIFASQSELHSYFTSIRQKNRNLTRYLEWMAMLGSLSCLLHFHGVSAPSVGSPSLPGTIGWDNEYKKTSQLERTHHGRAQTHQQKPHSLGQSRASWSHTQRAHHDSDLSWLMPEQTEGFFQFLTSTLAKNSIGLSNLLCLN